MKLATRIVKLYPRAWRERYEIEMLALLEEYLITFRTIFGLQSAPWMRTWTRIIGLSRRQFHSSAHKRRH